VAARDGDHGPVNRRAIVVMRPLGLHERD
jgi:hypothetical protein